MKKASVLVVEDHPDTRNLLTGLLQMYGYEVTPAKDGAIAWQLLESTRPDIVVTDLTMPHVSGFELIRHIKEKEADQLRRIPVVAMSAFGNECLSDAQKAGASQTLRKPFDAEELAGLINQVLAA
ncbi:MAG TPA: response regulator [Blastocatellia bacterium]|nr:response regulator [Blastocatellia bacterium]